MISSVEMLSPTFINTGPAMVAGMRSNSGRDFTLGAFLQFAAKVRQRRAQRRFVHDDLLWFGPLGVLDAVCLFEGTRVGDLSGECARSRGFGTAEEDAVLAGAGAPGEVARDRSQAIPAGGRGLAHPDAAVASGLVDAGTARVQLAEISHLDEVLQHREVGFTSKLTSGGTLRPSTIIAGTAKSRSPPIRAGPDVGLVEGLALHVALNNLKKLDKTL